MSLAELSLLPATSNFDLDLGTPYRLTLAEFNRLPATSQQLRARNLIYSLEDALFHEAAAGNPDIIHQHTWAPVHRFYDGFYVRELTMPAGYLIVGKRHAQEHLVVMTEGACICYTERGQEYLEGACKFMSPAGEKRVLHILEKTTWLTIHKTNQLDIEGIERELILAEPRRHLLNSPSNQGSMPDAQQNLIS